MKKYYQKASKKLSNMSHQIYYNYKYCFSPDLPAELGRGPDSEYWGRGGILLTDPLLVGLFAPSGVRGCGVLGFEGVPSLPAGVLRILGLDPKACLYSG